MDSWIGRRKILTQGDWAKFERRGSRRTEVASGLLPGELFCMDRGEPFAAVAVNVSQNGFMIETEYLLEAGANVVLQLPLPYGPVKLKVAWQDWADFKHSLLRCGMVQMETTFDLEEIFRAYGCFDTKPVSEDGDQ